MYQSDQEIYSLCGVNLVFLDETTYGIIKHIRVPTSNEVQQPTPMTAVVRKKPAKKTCLESGRGRTLKTMETKQKQGKRPRTLSESHQATFGIAPRPVVSRSIRSSRQIIDYLKLNDGLEDNEVSSPKCRGKVTHRPRSCPSSTRQAAQKHTTTSSTESQVAKRPEPKSTLPAIPPAVPPSASRSTPSDTLTGVLDKIDDQIPPRLSARI